MLLYVYVQVNARKTGLIGEIPVSGLKYGRPNEVTALRIKLAASPVDGDANEELIKFLTEYYKVPKSKYKILEIKQ
jgi:uncharacterized protein YggU (UPF0235/DUF167 family)